jgi:GcrA cell cycle regulator
MRNDSWTEEQVALRRKLWAEGKTAAAIGVRLGSLSRSAVMGKVFRLRLHAVAGAAKTKQSAAADGRGRKNAAPARRRRGSGRHKRAQSPPAKRTQHKTLLELSNDTCRWPHGRPGTSRFFFCGAPEADLERGTPYCARHMRRAYPAGAGVDEDHRIAPSIATSAPDTVV